MSTCAGRSGRSVYAASPIRRRNGAIIRAVRRVRLKTAVFISRKCSRGVGRKSATAAEAFFWWYFWY